MTSRSLFDSAEAEAHQSRARVDRLKVMLGDAVVRAPFAGVVVAKTVGLIGIKILVRFVTFFMVIGAALGTMNAMFSAVDSRKRELATLRALGFRRRSILLAVVIESSLISLSGGLVGLLLALPINGISTGTTNFQTFSEIAFSFRISPEVVMFALGLSLFAGVMGGLIPALRAARLPITTALREV